MPTSTLPTRRSSRHLHLLWVAIVALLLTPGATLAAFAATGTDNPDTVTSEDIDELIQGRMTSHGIPGVAVAVVQGGEIIHLEGYGNADPAGIPVDPDTPFLIGSVSKTFTSLAVYQLVRDGALSLDQPVVPLLSDIAEEPAVGFESVTIQHLLSHTSGLSMADGLAGTMEVHAGQDALRRRIQEILSRPLNRTPGEEYEYSNAGAVLLAGVVEQVTGETFGEYLNSSIFGPLGMDRSFASEADIAATDLATGHRQWFGLWTPTDLPYDLAGVPNGYIGSTARDLARFMQAHLDGEPAGVMPLTVAEISERRVTPTGWDVPLEASHSTGWFVDEVAGERVVSHAGSLGHFTAHVIIASEADQLGIAVLTNASAFVAAGHAGQYDLSLELARLLLGAEPEPAEGGLLMTTVVPAASWAGAIAILVAAARFLRRRRRVTGRHHDRSWLRTVLPSVAFVGTGLAILLVAPLDAARHFYPDVGWGLTATGYVATGWGVLRMLLVELSRRNARGTESRAAADQPNDLIEVR